MFHVYNRRLNRERMFFDDLDRDNFLECLVRYLTKSPSFDARGRPYANLRNQVRLVTFSLMPNHFHLVLFQIKPGGIERLMHAALDGYVQKFNRRHGVIGNMFNGEYRARPLNGRREELDAILYVHDNHERGCECRYCGNRWFDDADDSPGWIEASAALELFGGYDGYAAYRQARAQLRAITD